MTADEELEARLENWGRWAFAGSRTKSRSMPLYCLIDRGENGNAEVKNDVGVDDRDALLVQEAWSSLPFSSQEERAAKLLLGYTYCSDATRSSVLKRIRKMHRVRIESKDAEKLLGEAKRKIKDRLAFFTKNECATVPSQSEAATRSGGQCSPLRAPRENEPPA